MPAMDYSRIADLYDLYARTDLDVAFFLEETRGCRSVLELTSGTGRLSIPLLQAKVPLSCLDSSPEMLSILREKLHRLGISAPVYEMDLVDFRLDEQFDCILIPFNSFSEIVSEEDQLQALVTIRRRLSPQGKFLCTLHNPAVRTRTIDGQIHQRGQYPLPGGAGTLFLSSLESYDPRTHLVQGAQFYELYSPAGILETKRFVELKFYLHTRETFEALARSAGFEVAALFGDYSHAPFDPDRSPFLIYCLVSHAPIRLA